MYNTKKDMWNAFAYMEHLISERKNPEARFLLDATPSMMNMVDTTGQTLLYVATKHLNLEIMEHLIRAGCDVDAKDTFGWTPLMIAVKSDDTRPVELLLDYDADIFVTNSSGQNALHMYLDGNTVVLRIVDIFYEKVTRNTRNIQDRLVKLEQAGFPFYLLVFYLTPENLNIALSQRSCIGYHESAASVFFCMRNIIYRDDFQEILHNYYQENLKVLLQYGARVQERRMVFFSRFEHFAAEGATSERSLKVIEFFLQLIIDLKFSDQNTVRFVCNFFLNATVEQLHVILKSDVNSYINNEFGYEPIAHVFGNRSPDVIAFIETEKIDVNVRGIQGKSALHIAVEAHLHEHVSYLLSKGADPNVVDDCGVTPIFYVADPIGSVVSDSQCMKLLLKYGADLQICDSDGKFFIDHIDYTEVSTLEIILAHLALLQKREIPVKESFVDLINWSSKLAGFYEVMSLQLERMKTRELCGSLSIFDALTKNIQFLSRRVRSLNLCTTEVQRFYDDYRLGGYHPYYKEILYDRVSTACRICESRDKAANVICDCIKILSPYDLVVDKICSYLTFDDIRKIAYPYPN